jgi:cytochrome c-type biogenesis protein CcmE
MSDLDNELKDAIDRTSEVAEPVVKAAPPPTPQGRSRGNKILLVALLAMAAGVVTLVLVGLKSASIYALKVDQVVGKEELQGRKLRVDGELVPGTLVKRDKPCEYRFRMHSEGRELPVRYSRCEIPDSFRDRPEGGVLVTVEGTFGTDQTLEATDVFAKCSSKYDPKTHEMGAEGEKKGAAPTGDAIIR